MTKLAGWVLALAAMTACGTAHAYVDPNAGGLLFQILAPLLIALAAGWAWVRRSLALLIARVGRWFRKA